MMELLHTAQRALHSSDNGTARFINRVSAEINADKARFKAFVSTSNEANRISTKYAFMHYFALEEVSNL